MISYIDTSALAKWYLNERRSDDFDDYIVRTKSVAISRLTVVELRCLLARRRRAREISASLETEIRRVFENDLKLGVLFVHPLEDRHVLSAADLISSMSSIPLRTLDALHLAIATQIGAGSIATADRTMAAAAKQLGLDCVRFD